MYDCPRKEDVELCRVDFRGREVVLCCTHSILCASDEDNVQRDHHSEGLNSLCLWEGIIAAVKRVKMLDVA